MPLTNYDMFLQAKKYLRRHPDATDEETADACGLHRLIIDRTVAVARRELAARGEIPAE